MPFSYDSIRKIVLWALQYKVDIEKLVEALTYLYNTLPSLDVQASGDFDSDEMYAALMKDGQVVDAVNACAGEDAVGALDGSRIRKILQFIKDHPELVSLITMFI